MSVGFLPAENFDIKGRLMLFGPSGSGKTFTALTLASHLIKPGEKIAVIDTENGTSAKYRKFFDFDILKLGKYSPEDYINAMALAVEGGYGALIVDSTSHEWMGVPGGCVHSNDLLAQAKFKGNTWAAWSVTRPRHNRFLHAMQRCPMHFIGCYRTKTEWTKPDKGGIGTKVGLAPEADSNDEYEYDLALQLDMSNNALVSKTRLHGLVPTGQLFEKPGQELAEVIAGWLASGAPETARAEDVKPVTGNTLTLDDEPPPVATMDLDKVVEAFALGGAKKRAEVLAATNFPGGSVKPIDFIKALDPDGVAVASEVLSHE